MILVVVLINVDSFNSILINREFDFSMGMISILKSSIVEVFLLLEEVIYQFSSKSIFLLSKLINITAKFPDFSEFGPDSGLKNTSKFIYNNIILLKPGYLKINK
ncbi:hypothetical protein TGUWTKB_4900 [Candidatus Tachikawaea gelatinosa]|uniref:Uncharacterized protein n=1 Tax=Candidatus Tachikawaea gelatinosa TaxID=1410383 RepID=A0A090BWJ5_9ENTR|nr:hypothetical protein TGUWTKB_4900 [Candidatus Tachikawaea gelatinosa]